MERSANRTCRLRPYRADEAAALQKLADDPLVAQWMTRSFPSPYTLADAQDWIGRATSDPLQWNVAIEVHDELAGGIGGLPHSGERTGTIVVGYWLGRHFWGKGIATEALSLYCDALLSRLAVRRLEATVFEPNRASAAVLRHCGFVCEATMRAYYIDRDGLPADGWLFARVQ